VNYLTLTAMLDELCKIGQATKAISQTVKSQVARPAPISVGSKQFKLPEVKNTKYTTFGTEVTPVQDLRIEPPAPPVLA
jgi:hypothetical protein